MNVFEQAKNPVSSILSSPVAMILIISTLLWATGAPLLMRHADAAQLLNVSDTLTDSNLGAGTKHVIRYTTASSTPAGGTIKIQFDAAGSAFSQIGSAATSTDISATGMTVVSNLAACTGGADRVYPVPNYNNGTDENITFTVCPSNTVGTGAKTITIGTATSTPLITNPAVTGSYRVTISGSNGDYGDTRVAVLGNVTVTAAVDTIFTFTVAGLATSTSVNGDSTTGSTTATAIPFGTIAPGPGGAKVMGQRLTVVTNAANGFSVTVVENQNLLSATGADIDLFQDGVPVATPATWASPSNTLGSENSYGHIGVTSDDAITSNGAEFVGSKYAGNFGPGGPRQVFYHNLPSNGTVTGVGTTDVAYKLEIGSLQEAGNDYTNTLTYVATPIF